MISNCRGKIRYQFMGAGTKYPGMWRLKFGETVSEPGPGDDLCISLNGNDCCVFQVKQTS